MFSKCKFWLRKVQCLGHLVNYNDILVEPLNIETVMRWNVPKARYENQSFLFLVGYYRRFIHDFSKIANPFTRLMRKDATFH